jgi:hypothetical protein
MSTHNKKRNTGLLYEFLVTVISQSLIDGNQQASARALKILRRHFKPGTLLYQEFRLINSLRKTKVSSDAVAASILQEAKLAVRSHDVKSLDREKSLLIKVINHSLNDDDFYDRPVNEYKLLATVQTLFNDWRRKDCDLTRLAGYEDAVVKHLVREQVTDEAANASVSTSTFQADQQGSNRLLMKVMMKKLNEKYQGVLNDDQKALVRAYAFAAANEDESSIKFKLNEVRERLISSIDAFRLTTTDKYVSDKLANAREQLIAENVENVDDELVTRFMLYTKLTQELDSPEEK